MASKIVVTDGRRIVVQTTETVAIPRGTTFGVVGNIITVEGTIDFLGRKTGRPPRWAEVVGYTPRRRPQRKTWEPEPPVELLDPETAIRDAYDEQRREPSAIDRLAQLGLGGPVS